VIDQAITQPFAGLTPVVAGPAPTGSAASSPASAACDRLAAALLPPTATLAEALARMDAAGTGVLLVASASRRLVGLLTDGDLRRAILAGSALDAPALPFVSRDPLAVGPDAGPDQVLELLDHGRDYAVHHIPVVADDGAVLGLWLRSDIVRTPGTDLRAMIMAGGYGMRLRPLTDGTPKPMLPVGDRPLLELTIERLRASGIRHVGVATHYLAECITRHFGDGSAFGVEISYFPEEQPLGTAGALRALPEDGEPLLVLNGDVLTGVNFARMLAFHRECGAELTVGVREHVMEVPYGVVDCDDTRVLGIREKPCQRYLVNAGIYLLESGVRRFVPDDLRFDMPDLIARLLSAGRPVAAFPILEYWLDIGRPADYARAQADIATARL
jgi:dTDP-glucose pyrophosphorylase